MHWSEVAEKAVIRADENDCKLSDTDGETEDSDQEASSDLSDGSSDDGLVNPKVGDEDSDEAVIIDPDTMDLQNKNLGPNPRSKSYTLIGLNRIVGLKLSKNLKLFVPAVRYRYESMRKDMTLMKKAKTAAKMKKVLAEHADDPIDDDSDEQEVAASNEWKNVSNAGSKQSSPTRIVSSS